MRMSESPFDEGCAHAHSLARFTSPAATCRLIADTLPLAPDNSTYASIPTIPYELPDGNVVHVGVDRFRVPELLMAPEGVKVRVL